MGKRSLSILESFSLQIQVLVFSDLSENYEKHVSIYYCQTSNIRNTLVGNKIVDHLDVVGALLVGAAPTSSSFSTYHLAGQRQLQDETRNI